VNTAHRIALAIMEQNARRLSMAQTLESTWVNALWLRGPKTPEARHVGAYLATVARKGMAPPESCDPEVVAPRLCMWPNAVDDGYALLEDQGWIVRAGWRVGLCVPEAE
jgi:hypothetical protein